LQNKHSSGGFLVHELVLPSRITIPPVDSSFMSWYFLVESPFLRWISRTGRITIYPVEGECWHIMHEKSSGNNSRIPYYEGIFTPEPYFLFNLKIKPSLK
jgi:hypothetical protein